VRLGRTAAHLAVAAGPWRVLLPVDDRGRYPDVAGVIPRDAPTVAGIDETDAAGLLRALPGLPGGDDDCRPVTLDLGGGVAVRARDAATGKTGQLRLERSPSAGPPARVAVDRRVLARALALGCHTLRVAPGKPVVFEAGPKTLICAPLDPADAVDPAGTPKAVTDGTGAGDAQPTERRSDVSPNERGDRDGRPPTGGEAAEAPDPLGLAEDLRAALADALARTARLVAALRAKQREKRALASVYAGLKQLNLGPEGRP
jgi:hypothetical protein